MSTTDDLQAVWAPRVLSILRIVAALIFFEHGTQKLLGFPPTASAPAFLSLSWIAGALELVGGALLALGLFTRPVAFVLSGEMAFAYWIGARAAQLLPGAQRGRRGDPLLLRVPLPRVRRRRPLEPRRAAGWQSLRHAPEGSRGPDLIASGAPRRTDRAVVLPKRPERYSSHSIGSSEATRRRGAARAGAGLAVVHDLPPSRCSTQCSAPASDRRTS